MMSALYIFLLLTLVKGAQTGTSLIQDAINAIHLRQTQKPPCDLSKLPPGYQVIHCTDHKQPCDMKCNIRRTNVTMDACCIDGIWDIPNSGTAALQSGHVRHKRFLGLLIGAIVAGVVVGVGAIVACHYLCPKQTQGVQRTWKPPTFDEDKCPPREIKTVYETDINKNKQTIHWNKPAAKDADGKVISDVRIVQGLDMGSEFPEGVHIVKYKAQDQKGYEAFCSFNITVQVVRCRQAAWPIHGYMICPSTDPIYGTRCSIACYEGYERPGDYTTECTKSGTWTSDTSQPCSKIKCPKPNDPQNGRYVCSAEQEYQSSCRVECNDGYGLEQITYSNCLANKTWSDNRQPVCKDIVPPEIQCVQSYRFKADSGNEKKKASWSLPEAVETDDGNDTKIVKISGPDVGSDLPVGFTTVQYRAVDSAGNESPICTISLYVEEIECLLPSSQIIDENLKFSCPNTKLGINCTLSCHSKLPLRGDFEITCSANGTSSVGKWTWSNEIQPYCEEIKCPTLTAPINGAMICDSISARPFCFLSCNKGFDVPNIFNGRYFCSDSGLWRPTNEVPNCTEPKHPSSWNLQSEFHYFSGSCNEETVIREIKENFLKIIARETLPEGFPTNVTIDNIRITCGAIQPRSRRTVLVDVSDKSLNLNGHWPVGISSNIRHKRQSNNTYNIVIQFDIVVSWTQGDMSLADAYTYHDNMTYTFRDKLIDLVNAGEFDLPGYSRPSYHFDDYGMFHCENGVLDNNVCKICLAGEQYNKVTKTCEDCPLNRYQDKEGTIPCKECPPHHVTLETGRKHVNECTELCPAGTYSQTSVVPCTTCPIGSYQSSIGQKTCISCPEGEITNSSGRTTDADCSKYDIYINRELSNLELKNLDVDAFDLTLALWLRVSTTENGPPNISLSSYHPNHGEYFLITIQDAISVRIQQALHTSSETVPLGKWVLLVVILDSDSRLLTIKLKDKTVLQESFFSGVNNTVLISGSSLRMNVGSNTAIRFTGLFLSSQNLSENRIQSLSSSCSYDIPPSLLSMSDISRFQLTSIQVEVPSSCDAVDECLSKPCGNHTCINIPSGFECSCLHGYSGSMCTTPPDLCRNNDCKNGATCINNGLYYKCKCSPGYSGDLCQEAPVNGNWSYWSTWSLCSQTCGGGSRSRSRQCNSPAPGDYGLNCTGHDHETDNCNIKECPSCPDLPLGNGTKVNITFVNGTEVRKISCQDGLAFAPGFEPDQDYKCGISTNYNWAHTSTANPLGRPPSCGEISGPEKLATTTTILYDTLPCSASSVAKATIEDKRMSMPCVANNTCNVSVSTTCSNNGTVVAMITLSASLEGKENLDVQSFYDSNTVSDNLRDLVNTVIELETSTQKLVNETAQTFEVQDGGIIHHVNKRSIDAVGSVACPVGSVSSDGVCVECPVGTYYQSSSSTCQYCEIGAYQDETAQSVCKPCLLGYTTLGVGSVSIQDCTEKNVTINVAQDGKSRIKPDDGKTNLALIIGCSLAGVILVASGLIGIIIYKWKTRTHSKGSFLSLRRVISSEPVACVRYQSPLLSSRM